MLINIYENKSKLLFVVLRIEPRASCKLSVSPTLSYLILSKGQISCASLLWEKNLTLQLMNSSHFII